MWTYSSITSLMPDATEYNNKTAEESEDHCGMHISGREYLVACLSCPGIREAASRTDGELCFGAALAEVLGIKPRTCSTPELHRLRVE